MSVAVHRVTFEHHVGEEILGRYREEPDGPWVHDPDVDAVLGDPPDPSNPLVPVRDWIWTGDTVRGMTQSEKDARDQAEAAAAKIALEAAIKHMVLHDPLESLAVSVTAAGLVLTVDIQTLINGEQTPIVADPADTKMVKVCYVYDQDADVFRVNVYEKTTGQYADLSADEFLIRDMAEFSLVANGTDLVEV